MSFFKGAHHATVVGGAQIAAASGSIVNYHHANEQGYSRARSELSAAAAHTALHDSAARFNAPRCHRNTRAKYINGLERWMLGQGEDFNGKSLIWLHGGAGAGKSAIMQSIIERCAQYWQAVILGTFFFFRADPSRNYAEVLIPTLAYQLACVFPAAMAVLESIIHRNPLIFKASLRTQAYELLVRPILHLIQAGIINSTSTPRRVFVIDGLDECTDPQKQALIISVIAFILCDNHLPICFLVASRPEVAIGSAFQREKRLHGVFSTITLDNDDDAKSDIHQFIEDSFLDIIDSHPLRHHIVLPWPHPYSIDQLVRNSSGHFIYAATAMKFIASSDEHPGRALEVVEGLAPSRTGSPFATLDALYTHILTSAKYSSQVLAILRHCVLTMFGNTVGSVCYIYNISPEDLELFLCDVQSLVFLRDAGTRIGLKHASFSDFLQDKNRSQALYIRRQDYHASCLERYFQLLDSGARVPTPSPVFLRDYAYNLICYLSEAIVHSQETDLLQSLIQRHSVYDIHNFFAEIYTPAKTRSRSETRYFIPISMSLYMDAICTFSMGIENHALYFHQFKLHVELILDGLNDLLHGNPQYRIIPAIFFSSSSPSGLHWGYRLLNSWSHRFGIDASYERLFHVRYGINGAINPLPFEAIRRLPQSRVSWSSGLAILMKLVLHQLVDLRRPSNMPYTDPHKQWLRGHKPLKQRALGSPRLSSTVFAKFSMRTHTDEWNPGKYDDWGPSVRFNTIWGHWHGWEIRTRKLQCLILLKAVILYLRKSDCTIEVVKLARKSLPMAALWYPKLMKRVRAEMDSYILRWEESPSGLSEIKDRVISINDMN